MAFTILSFCGGGIRGLASATMLQKLYAQYPNVVKNANMLAGTSTGAGIVAALATQTMSPDELIGMFMTTERTFYEFSGDIATQPAYSVSAFATNMGKLYGTTVLSQLSQNVLMTSFNVGDADTPWFPQLFHNFPGSSTAGTLVSDAVVSSGAMPGMFGSYNGNVDGAFVHHDPTIAAIALAVNSGVALTDIVAICFGTGFMKNSLGSATANWGAEQWQNGDPQNAYNTPPLLIEGTTSPILNISLNGTSTNLMPQLAGMLLAQPQSTPATRYAYLNPTLDRFIPENDTNMSDLEDLANLAANVDFSAAEYLIQHYWPQQAAAGR